MKLTHRSCLFILLRGVFNSLIFITDFDSKSSSSPFFSVVHARERDDDEKAAAEACSCLLTLVC